MSENSFKVVSFYTKNTGYETEIMERLVPSLERHNLSFDVVGIESKGSWNLNIYQKAYVIGGMLKKHHDKNIVWLDADAEVVRYPELFDTTDCDFGFHYRFNRKLSSGTMFFRNNGRVSDLIEHWIKTIERHPEYGLKTEQELLLEVLPEHPDLKIGHFPLEYSMIFDGEQVDDPVVVHHQASRRFKKAISDESQAAEG